MKSIIQLLFVSFLWGCQTQNFYVIDYDKKEDSGKGMGIVSFSLYLDKEGDLLNYRCPGCFNFSITDKNKNEKASKFVPMLYKTTETENGIENHQNIWGNADSPFVALLLPEDKLKDIYLSSFLVQLDPGARAATTGDISNLITAVVILDAAQSIKALNLTPEPGKIKYLGLFRVKITNILDRNQAFSKAISIERDSAGIFGSSTNSLVNRGYFDEQNNSLGNEIRFYKEFIKSHKTGYWHNLAEKKLKELTSKIK